MSQENQNLQLNLNDLEQKFKRNQDNNKDQ